MQPTSTESAQVAEEIPVAGGDLFISMPEYVETLDPLLADNEEVINILSLIYETPFKYNADGSLSENLIESWSVDETKQVFTFKIRQNVFFSDESQLTADDIVYSANKLINNAVQSESPTSNDTNDNGNSNSQPEQISVADNNKLSSRYCQFSQYVDSINAQDQFTVQLRMNRAGGVGLHFMTFPVMKKTTEQQAYLIGTGPYMAESFVQGEDMRLVRNPLWWQGEPYIETIVAKSVTSQSQALDYVESSIIDFTTTDVLYAGNYKKPGMIQVVDYVTNYYDCLVPNLLKPKMQNALVRQAISYGIDRREILATVLLNHGVPTNLPIAPDFFAYDSKYKINDYGNSQSIEFLKQAGYATDEVTNNEILTLDLLVLDDRNAAYRKEAARAIKKQLGNIGIEINIIEKTSEEYALALKNGDFDLAYVSYYLDIVPNIEELFSENSPLNVGHVSSEEIINAARKCESALTEEEMITAYSELQQVLAERVPQIGLYFHTNSIVCDETIHGIKDIRQNLIFNDISQWYIYIPGVTHGETIASNNQNQVKNTEESAVPDAENQNVETKDGIKITYATGSENETQWSIDGTNDENNNTASPPNINDEIYNNSSAQTDETS